MRRAVSIAGYLLTEDEWRDLDDEHRRDLLRALADTGRSRRRDDDLDELYELTEPT